MTKQYPMKYPLKNWRAVNMNWGIQILCHDAPNIVIATLGDSLEGSTRSPSVKAAGDLIASAPALAAEVARLQAQVEAMREALLMVQCRLNTRPGGVVYFTGEEWTQIDKSLGGVNDDKD